MRNKAGPIDYSKVDDSKFNQTPPSFEEVQEEISSRYKAELEHLEHVFNPESIKKLFSKSWHNREKAMTELSNEAKSLKGHDPFIAALHVVKVSISDKITQVSSKGVVLFSQCLSSPEAMKWHLSHALLHPILIHILQQSADNRAAVRQPAIASYKKFLDLLKRRSKAEYSEYVQFLLSDRSYLKKVLKGSFRHAQVRLLLFKEVMSESGDYHLPVHGIVDYAIDALAYPNADVRHQAMEVIKAAYKRVGFSRLEKQLNFIPQNLRQPLSSTIPEIREMLGVEKAQKGLQQAISPKKQGNAKTLKKEGHCQFCGKKSKDFRPNLDYTDSASTILDLHYLQECKMLMQCPGCDQIIEISTLNKHLLKECTNSELWARCKRCSEAIPKEQLESHTRANICEPGKNPNTSNRCPLCHIDIPPYDKGWKQHLLVEFCPKNSR